MNQTMLDIIIFGGVALVVAGVALTLRRTESKRKIHERVQKVAHKTLEERVEEKALMLRRQKDTSLEGYGLDQMANCLTARIHNAGLEVSAKNYLLVCLAIASFVFLLMLLLDQSIFVTILLSFIIGFGLPHFYCGYRISKQKQQFLKLFPDAIELIVRGLRAGLPVTESMQTVSQEIPEPVAPVFSEICDQVKLGVPLEKAMESVALSLQMTEFNFFFISVTLQRETGGNLGEILSNLAEVLRQRQMLKLKIKAMSSEARASSAIVGSLPFLVVMALLFISPDYLTPLFDDIRGNIAAGVAAFSLTTGIFVMNRMTKFKI